MPQRVWALLIDVAHSEGAASTPTTGLTTDLSTGKSLDFFTFSLSHCAYFNPFFLFWNNNVSITSQHTGHKWVSAGGLLLEKAEKETESDKINMWLSVGEEWGHQHKYVSNYCVISSTVLMWSSFLCTVLIYDLDSCQISPTDVGRKMTLWSMNKP